MTGRGTAVGAAVAVLVLLATADSALGQRALVADPGPGAPGRLLRDVVSRPHRVVVARDRWAHVQEPTDSGSVVVVRGSARVDAVVTGDVVVVDGDLRLANGARIGGRAVAIGGHVFRSAFARVGGGVVELPQDRFDADSTGDGWRLRWGPLVSQYGTPPLRLPGFAGLRVAAYSRVDGLALTFGPEFNAGGIRWRPGITYRSHIGAWDPSAELRIGTRRTALRLTAERATVTNEGWIASPVAAAGVGLLTGVDVADWYRADRGAVMLETRQDQWPMTVLMGVGAGAERVWATGSAIRTASRPWTLSDPRPRNDFSRPNPAVPTGRLTTALARVGVWGPTGARRTTGLVVTGEVSVPPWDSLGHFTQFLADWRSVIPIGSTAHTLESWGHGAWSSGATPPQRFVAAGGPGTLPTEPTLGMRGDRLALGSVRYRVGLGEQGALGVALAWTRGRVGTGGWQRGVTNWSAQADVASWVRIEVAWDPAARRWAALAFTTLAPRWPLP